LLREGLEPARLQPNTQQPTILARFPLEDFGLVFFLVDGTLTHLPREHPLGHPLLYW